MNCFLRVLGESCEFCAGNAAIMDHTPTVSQLRLGCIQQWYATVMVSTGKTVRIYNLQKKKKKTIFSKNVEVQADTCSVPCGGTGDLISRERHTFEMLIPQIWEAAYEMTSGRITSHKDVPGLFPRNCANTWQKGLCGRDWGSWSWEIILNHSGPDDREFSQNRRCGDHRSRSWDDGRRKPQGKEHRKPPEAAEDEEANSP